MARWIHEFRSMGERALTSGERVELRRRAARLSLFRWMYAALAVLGATSAIGCLVAFAGERSGGALLLMPLLILAGYALSWASAAEKLALLHRRALRLGLVEEFLRVRGDETARRMWGALGVREAKDEAEGEGEPVVMPTNEYWRIDERFEERLRRSAGGPVEGFTAVARDGAVLWVEGKPVRRLLEPPVWEVVG